MLKSAWSGVRTAKCVGLLALALPATLAAQATRDWCDDEGDRSRPRHCEVREFTLSASGSLRVNARPNGGIDVEAWDRNEVLVQAKVVGRAESEERARAIASQVEIERDATVRADGPDTRRREGWSVSYRIFVPREYDLDLTSMNGGIGVEGVRGQLELETTNGGLHLGDVGDDVRGRTTNGGLHIQLSGSRWQGEGLDARTTNGGVNLVVPEGYSAHLEAATTNGGFSVDFPITVSGRIGRRLSADLGSGGAPVRVVTTNGGVRVTRPGR